MRCPVIAWFCSIVFVAGSQRSVMMGPEKEMKLKRHELNVIMRKADNQ